jgi:putative protein kinase ArgK-like GTPase of G3E family
MSNVSDTVEIKLPLSGSTVVIRNYTTRKDDRKAGEILYRGVDSEQEADENKKPKMKVKFPIANVVASEESYIPRLVQSIDGDSTNLELRLDDLKSEDYEAVEKAVEKIVDEHSPKAREAKKASKDDTNKK